MSNPWYRDYADFLAERFPGRKIQKISVDAGFTCPNRDGTKGRGGCSYCNNRSFTPGYCRDLPSVTDQIERGKTFFGRHYPDARYLAYFQAYTGTYAPLERVMELYREAVAVDGVVGLVIATRPDCVSAELLSRLASMGCFVMIEYGAETACDATLVDVGRGHTWADTVAAVNATAAVGIPVGLHLIMGLPGESRSTMLDTIDRVNRLAVDVVKIHQLQLIRDTRLWRDVADGRCRLDIPSLDQYLDLCCDIVARLDPAIAIDRFVSSAPPELVVAPRWGLKNYQFTHLLHRRLAALNQ